jgi:hypothetical protein
MLNFNNKPVPVVVKWDTIKPFIENLSVRYGSYPFYNMEGRDSQISDENFLLYEGILSSIRWTWITIIKGLLSRGTYKSTEISSTKIQMVPVR